MRSNVEYVVTDRLGKTSRGFIREIRQNLSSEAFRSVELYDSNHMFLALVIDPVRIEPISNQEPKND